MGERVDGLARVDRQRGRAVDDAGQLRTQTSDGLRGFVDDGAQIVLGNGLQRPVGGVEKVADVRRNLNSANGDGVTVVQLGRIAGHRAGFRRQLHELLADGGATMYGRRHVGGNGGVAVERQRGVHTDPGDVDGRDPADLVAAVGHHRRRVQSAGGGQLESHVVTPDPQQRRHLHEAERHHAAGHQGDGGQDGQLDPHRAGQAKHLSTPRSGTGR